MLFSVRSIIFALLAASVAFSIPFEEPEPEVCPDVVEAGSEIAKRCAGKF